MASFDPVTIVKQYPLQTVGVVIGVVGIAYIYMRRRGAANAIVAASGVDPVAAQYDLQMRQLQASINRDVAVGQLNYDYNMAKLEAELAATKIAADTQLALSRDLNAAQLAATNTAANVSLAQILENAAVQKQKIDADLAINAQQTAMQRDMINAN